MDENRLIDKAITLCNIDKIGLVVPFPEMTVHKISRRFLMMKPRIVWPSDEITRRTTTHYEGGFLSHKANNPRIRIARLEFTASVF